MKRLQQFGNIITLLGLLCFTVTLFTGPFVLKSDHIELLSQKEQDIFAKSLNENVVGKQFNTSFGISSEITALYTEINNTNKEAELWDLVSYKSAQDFAAPLVSAASQSPAKEQQTGFLLLTLGAMVLGGLMVILPKFKTYGYKGIKHNHIYQKDITSGKGIAYLLGGYLIAFYILLYWFPAYIVNWVHLVDGLSMAISGNPASRWFLYGFMYCLVMLVMGVRMIAKYRHNRYQIIRTVSVIFFQIAFAFLIPEILVRFNKPYMDFKNIWPLDYDFFFAWNLDQMIAEGTLGIFMLVWGIALFVIAVPVITYFAGKRWYCSWVCGCGGLAETAGDPFRQLSDKSVKAWKFERFSIHGVLVLAVVMTGMTLYSYFSGATSILGLETYTVQKSYGFMVGSVLAGVVGTGFYPKMGNRVWCRFACPLAAYLGIVQRFKSRFRITTNGGQCISCGNCSTYCEMGIDVRAYAQRGQNIVRSSCVGCGVCAAVCPRGVLRLENGPEEGRLNENPIIIGNDAEVTLDLGKKR